MEAAGQTKRVDDAVHDATSAGIATAGFGNNNLFDSRGLSVKKSYAVPRCERKMRSVDEEYPVLSQN